MTHSLPLRAQMTVFSNSVHMCTESAISAKTALYQRICAYVHRICHFSQNGPISTILARSGQNLAFQPKWSFIQKSVHICTESAILAKMALYQNFWPDLARIWHFSQNGPLSKNLCISAQNLPF